MKSLWITSLAKDEAAIQKLTARFKTYGIQMEGHFWQNDNAKLAWLGARDEITGDRIAVWAILGTREELLQDDLRYGLSLLSLSVQARRGVGFPMVILQTDGDPLSTDDLPTPLRRVIVLPAADPGTPAKLVAKLHAKAPKLPAPYYLDMVGNEQLGQWLEVRPTGEEAWPGVIFGVEEGEIVFQAVGPPGRLPKTTVLNYAMQGLQLELGATSFTAWAARNEVSTDYAYFVKIKGCPRTLLFGPYVEDEAAELYIVHLQ